MQTAKIFKELIPYAYTTNEKKAKEFFNLKLFITANNQELGSRFQSFTAKSRVDIFINFFSSLFVFFLKFLPESKGKIPNFNVSFCLHRFYGTIRRAAERTQKKMRPPCELKIFKV